MRVVYYTYVVPGPANILLIAFPGKRAESMESLLSLSDVEVGVDEHTGDLEDIDYRRKKIKRRVSQDILKICMKLTTLYKYVSTLWLLNVYNLHVHVHASHLHVHVHVARYGKLVHVHLPFPRLGSSYIVYVLLNTEFLI